MKYNLCIHAEGSTFLSGGCFYHVFLFLLSGFFFPYQASAAQHILNQHIGDWHLHCEADANNSQVQRCIADQLVTLNNDQDKVLLGVMVGYLSNHPMPHIIFRLGPGVNTQRGAAVKVDNEEYLRVPVSDCDKKTCEIRSFIPDTLLVQMLKGKTLKFAFFQDDEQLTYVISLTGFAKAYELLKPIEN